MKNSEFIEILDDINFFIKAGNYKRAMEIIKEKKSEVLRKENPSSEYIEDLISNLK